MKNWRRPFGDDDEDEGFSYLLDDDGDDGDDDDEGSSKKKKRKRRRSYPAPRPLRVTRFDGLDDDDDGDDDEESFELLEAKIRTGKYKPKKSDPWTAHILYQNLKALGEI